MKGHWGQQNCPPVLTTAADEGDVFSSDGAEIDSEAELSSAGFRGVVGGDRTAAALEEAADEDEAAVDALLLDRRSLLAGPL